MITRIKKWFRKKALRKQLVLLMSLDDYLKSQGISRQSRRYFWRRMSNEEDRNKTILQLIKEISETK